MLKDKKTLLIISVAVLGIAIGSAIGFFFLPKWQSEQSYSAVYMASGEVYVGKLSLFPQMVLSNPYLLGAISNPKDPTKSSFQLTPLATTLWAPSKIYLNPKEVIFYGEVGKGSSVDQGLRGTKL